MRHTSRGALPSMMTASSQRKAPADPAALPGVFRHAGRVGSALLTAAALSVFAPEGTQAEERSASPMAARVNGVDPRARGVHRERHEGLRRARPRHRHRRRRPARLCQGLRRAQQEAAQPVDTDDRLPDRLDHQGLPRHDDGDRRRSRQVPWDDRVVDLDPDFQLKDPWVTREFRMFDLLAQRSGLPPYANDMLGLLGLDAGRDDPLAALCRAGVELPLDLRLHQHHPSRGRPHRREGEGAPDWKAVLATRSSGRSA